MISKTGMLALIKDLRSKEIEAGLAEKPELLGVRDKKGRNWLHLCCGENLPLARSLLERGADPNHCLWAAAGRENVAAIKLLVANGAEIDPVAEGHTPFLGAVQWSRFRAAKALLELGANVDYQDSTGMTALHYMLKKGSDERHFRMLIQHGARGDIPNADGATAAEIMGRKRRPAFRTLAAQLLGGIATNRDAMTPPR